MSCDDSRENVKSHAHPKRVLVYSVKPCVAPVYRQVYGEPRETTDPETNFGIIPQSGDETDFVTKLKRFWCMSGGRTIIDEAVEEIERLRATISTLEIDREQLREQRDSHRRRICEDAVRNGGCFRRKNGRNVECETVEEVAEVCGWDCYASLAGQLAKLNPVRKLEER